MRFLRLVFHALMIVLLAALLAAAPFVHGHRGGAGEGGAHVHFPHVQVGVIHIEADESDVVDISLGCAGTRESGVAKELAQLRLPTLASDLTPRRLERRVPLAPDLIARVRLHACGLPPPAAAPPLTA